MTIDDWIPVGLYAIGMVGFVTAGVGLLGLRPLDVAISPLLVLASGLSLVAIVRFADPTLWFGAVCDVALLLVGLWRAYGGWPVHPSHGRVWHAVGLATGFAFLGYVAVATTLFPWHRTWGSTRDELIMALPGDRVPRNAGLETQRAVTIETSPDRVARVLADLDQKAFVVLPTADGGTRLIRRSTAGHERLPVWVSAIEFIAFELPRFIAERRTMLTIKARAERLGEFSTSR